MASLGKKGTLKKYPPVVDRVDQLIDTIGDGSGTAEQAAAPAEYIYRPSIGSVGIVERINIYIETAARITPAKYGDQAALTSGILVTIKDSSGGVLHDFTPQPVKVTQHWGLLAGSDVSPSAFAAGADAVNIRWTITKGGSPVTINGDKGEYLSVDIRDSLAAFTSQLMQIQGYMAVN